jgi:hypothetical protein
VVPRTDQDRDTQHIRLLRLRVKLLEARHALQALNDIEPPQVGCDRDLLSPCECRGDGDGAAEKRLALLHVPICGDGDTRHAFQVLDVRRNHDVDVLGSTYDAPRIDGKSSHYDELNLSCNQLPQQLVKGRLAQLLRAAPVNRMSLWLSAIPSARFTLIGRCASSRSRCTRTASAVAAADEVVFFESLTKKMLAANHYPIATMRSIGMRARSAIAGGTLTSNFISRSESRSFGRVIIFMYLQ